MAAKKEIVLAKGYDKKAKLREVNVPSKGVFKVFEIPVGNIVGFRLRVVSGAYNTEQTQIKVYWVAQSVKKFGTKKFLSWGSGPQEKELHLFLDELDNPITKIRKYTDSGVGENYIKSFEVVNGELIYHNFVISYKGSNEGKGIWLEAFNYYPEFKEQGAFLVPVAKPYIKKFLVFKTVGLERLYTYDGIIKPSSALI